jgi:hypothetical protein
MVKTTWHRNCLRKWDRWFFDRNGNRFIKIITKADVMSHIEEMFLDTVTVLIRIDGRLEKDALPTLESVCNRHLDKGKKIRLDLQGLMHISAEAKDYLRRIWGQVAFADVPEFLNLEMTGEETDKGVI